MSSMNAYGKLLALASLPFVVGGIVGHGLFAAPARPSLNAKDAAAVQKMLATAPALTAGSPVAVDAAVQGDDTLTVVRVEGNDAQGPVTIYLLVDNGTVVGGSYAQNGSSGQQ